MIEKERLFESAQDTALNLAPQMQGFPPSLRESTLSSCLEASTLFPSPCYASELSLITGHHRDFLWSRSTSKPPITAMTAPFAVGLAAVRRAADRSYAVVPDPAARLAVRIHLDPWPPMGGRARLSDLRRSLAHPAGQDRTTLISSLPTTRRLTVASFARVCGKYGIRVPLVRVHLYCPACPLAVGNLPDAITRCLPERLRIRLRHHDPESDAEACASIVLAAEAEGWQRRQQFP